MDEIEVGFTKIMEKIEDMKKTDARLSEEVQTHDSELLGRMAVMAKPVVKSVGLKLLKIGKQDTKGELYHPNYYNEKMIVLGKCEPAPSALTTPQKRSPTSSVSFQNGAYSMNLCITPDGFLTDSFLNPIDPKGAIDTYGYDIMFMLYRGMHDYMKSEEDLISALEKVIGFIFATTQQSLTGSSVIFPQKTRRNTGVIGRSGHFPGRAGQQFF